MSRSSLRLLVLHVLVSGAVFASLPFFSGCGGPLLPFARGLGGIALKSDGGEGLSVTCDQVQCKMEVVTIATQEIRLRLDSWTLSEHPNYLRNLFGTWSSDGQHIAVMIYDEVPKQVGEVTAKIWDSETGQLVHTWSWKPDHDPRSVQGYFLPRNQQLLTADANEVRLWNLSSGQELLKLSIGNEEAYVSADGTKLILRPSSYLLKQAHYDLNNQDTASNEQIQIWEISNPIKPKKLWEIAFQGQMVVGFSPDQTQIYVVTAGIRKDSHHWFQGPYYLEKRDLSLGTVQSTWQVAEERAIWDTGSIPVLSPLADRLLIYGPDNRSIDVFDTEHQTLAYTMQDDDFTYTDVQFQPGADERVVFLNEWKPLPDLETGRPALYDIQRGKRIVPLSREQEGIYYSTGAPRCNFSSNGSTLACGVSWFFNVSNL